MNVVVYSKNRACQLDLLLRSVEKYLNVDYVLTVIYTYTNDEFKSGYDILKEKYENKLNIIFLDENTVKLQPKLMTLLAISNKRKYTIFLMDDMIFIREYNGNKLNVLDEDNDIVCLSLRLYPELNYSYVVDKKMPLPKFENNLIWNYKNAVLDWNYPMSLDAHIFRTEQIYNKILNSNFQQPNQLEMQLVNNPIQGNKMMCLDKNIVFNVPANRVQNVCHNRNENVDIEHLNYKYLKGNRIDLSEYHHYSNKSVHEPVSYILER